MPSKPVNLNNGRVFARQGDAEKHFLAIRDRHPLNTPIADADDIDDLLSLLERYDALIHDGPSKIGVGVLHFETRLNYTNGGSNVGFWVVRTDNSETDFSLFKAVSGRGTPVNLQFHEACRSAVGEALGEAKRGFFAEHADADDTIPCEAMGVRIKLSETRVDYVVSSFKDIVHAFRRTRGWTDEFPDGVITQPGDAQTITTFVDPVVAAAFRKYHDACAQVRLVSKSATAADLRQGATLPPKRPLRL